MSGQILVSVQPCTCYTHNKLYIGTTLYLLCAQQIVYRYNLVPAMCATNYISVQPCTCYARNKLYIGTGLRYWFLDVYDLVVNQQILTAQPQENLGYGNRVFFAIGHNAVNVFLDVENMAYLTSVDIAFGRRNVKDFSKEF